MIGESNLSDYISDVNGGVEKFVIENRVSPAAETTLAIGDVALNACLDLMNGSGKRIRGALVVNGYHMMGAEDEFVALQTAVAIEAVNTYMLVLDDMADNADTRRNMPSVHKQIETELKSRGYSGDVIGHARSHAEIAAAILLSKAKLTIQSLNLPAEAILEALNILEDCIIQTGHGQAKDLEAQGDLTATEETLDEIIRQKTSDYTFLMPLRIGIAIAGGRRKQLESVKPWAERIGYAFQGFDDAKPYLGEDKSKDEMSDIREGKATLILRQALINLQAGGQTSDYDELMASVGNNQLTEEQFRKAVGIVNSSGAVSHYVGLAETKIAEAHKELDLLEEQELFEVHGIDILRQVTDLVSEQR